MQELDCRGLKCPMPIVRVAQTVQSLTPGQLLEVQADDPAFRADVRIWSEITGNSIVDIEDGEELRAVIKRS